MRIDQSSLTATWPVASTPREQAPEQPTPVGETWRQSLREHDLEGSPTRDIEESGLPQSIQDLLKMIRDLRQQIARKQVQIEEVLNSHAGDIQQRLQRVRALQDEVTSLNGALLTATQQLTEQLRASQLTDAQQHQASLLALGGT